MFCIFITFCLTWFIVSPFAYGRPAEVIIMRHGEKPDQGDDLSLKGRERAAALVPFFLSRAGEMPVAIYAQRAGGEHRSRRMVETVAPLAHELKLDVKTWERSQYTDMIKEILDKPEYDGKIVLICWEHKAILDLATALGIAAPPDWPGQTFDRLWIINLNSGKATLKQESERLMYGDSAK